MTESDGDVTTLLSRWRAGDREAERQLLERFYPLLKDIARQRLRRTPGHVTLRATELVHEAYARLVSLDSVTWKDRSHFLALSANIIRNLVVDHVRTRHAEKRGGDVDMVGWDQLGDSGIEPVGEIDLDVDWLGLDRVLKELAEQDPKSARVVELKFFAGMENGEIADVMGISTPTVVREWRFARAWLMERLEQPSD